MDGDAFNEELDSAIDDLLPDDIDEVDAASTGSPLNDRTFGHTVDQDRAAATAEREIDDLADSLDVPDATATMANSIFEQFFRDESLEGRIIELYSAACLYCSCKVNSVPVNPEEVANVGDELLTRKRLLRRAKTIASTLGLDPEAFFDATQYVNRYCDELDLGTEVEERALEVLDACNAVGLGSGKSPSGRAAAAVYNAGLDTSSEVRQSDLSEAAGVTTVTIRNRYQEQREHLRQVERPPEDPGETVSWMVSLIGLSDSLERTAREKIEDAVTRFDGEVAESRQSWAAAALRLASEEAETPVGYKTLGQFTEADSSAIRRCERKLKNGPQKGGASAGAGREGPSELEPKSFASDAEFEAARERVVAALREVDEKTRETPELIDVLSYTDVDKELIARTFGSLERARSEAGVE